MVKHVVHLKSRLQQVWKASRACVHLVGRHRPRWLWALIGTTVLAIFMIFGILIKLNFGRVIYFLLLAWVTVQTLLFLLMAYIVPPPEPLSRRSALVARLVQFGHIIFSAFLLGVMCSMPIRRPLSLLVSCGLRLLCQCVWRWSLVYYISFSHWLSILSERRRVSVVVAPKAYLECAQQRWLARVTVHWKEYGTY